MNLSGSITIADCGCDADTDSDPTGCCYGSIFGTGYTPLPQSSIAVRFSWIVSEPSGLSGCAQAQTNRPTYAFRFELGFQNHLLPSMPFGRIKDACRVRPAYG